MFVPTVVFITQTSEQMHGEESTLKKANSPLFKGCDTPIRVGRYHSLAANESSLPNDLIIDAESEKGTIMSIRHRSLPCYGLQFHPESILTPCGDKMIKNFLDLGRGLEKMNTLAHLIDRLFSAKTMISQQIDIIIELDTLARANTLRELVAHCLLHADFTPTQNRCLDIVGTGATGLKTVNISTPSALILSNLGYQVIKHGNRAITSACGAADIQERLGFHAPKTVDDAEQRIAMKESVFLYAPYFHPLLKRIQDARKQLKKKTIFNLLGPLINPARPPFRIIGVSSIDDMQPMAEVLAADASVTRAIVVHSCGLDELSTCGPNCILQIEKHKNNALHSGYD